MITERIDEVKRLIDIYTKASQDKQHAKQKLDELFDITAVDRAEKKELLFEFVRWTVENGIRLDVYSYLEIAVFVEKYLDHLKRIEYNEKLVERFRG